MGNNDHQEPQQSDVDLASDILDFRELLRSGDREGLISALENPELYRLACDDSRYRKVVMQGISALAWDEPALASELLVRFDSQLQRKEEGSDAEQTAFSLMAALEWRQLSDDVVRPELAEILKNYFRSYPALHEDADLREKMHSALLQNPEQYAAFCKTLLEAGPVLPSWISHLHVNYLGTEGRRSAEEGLSESQQRGLSRAMVDLRQALRPGLVSYLVCALCITSIAVLPSALGVLLAIALLGGAMAFREHRSYENLVHPRLVRLAAESGVGSAHVLQWLYRERKQSGRVGNFDIKIENDRALELFAALVRTTLREVSVEL